MNHRLPACLVLLCVFGGAVSGIGAADTLQPAPAATTAITLPDSSRYQGETRDGLLNGQGSLVWRNNGKYQGGFKDGLMDGAGKLVTAGGDVYESQFVNGLPEGQGRVLLHNGDSYTGSFKGGLFSGTGTYRAKDGTVFEGDFLLGEPSGKGSIQWTNGNRYLGDVAAWHMSGTGTLTDNQGNRYQGQIKDDRFQGNGEYRAANGNVYKGQFEQGSFSGKGEIHYDNGDLYSGEVKNWHPEGVGAVQQKIGGSYRGDFSNGLYNGKGEYLFASGDRYVGEFKNGYFEGKGTYYLKIPDNDKQAVSGIWEHGHLIPPDDRHEKEIAALRAEETLSGQNVLVDAALQQIKPGVPDVPEMYFVAFGGDAKQNVFMKESRYTKQLFDDHFGTAGRSIALYNGDDGAKAPLATAANLRRVLLDIAQKMNREEDLLFLYLTSHGSNDHVLTVDLPGLQLPGLSAAQLAEIVRGTGIKWKVIVVSACFSGGFVDELKDDNSLIISSARRDRVSFGCSDDAEFTFFGRAYFADALPNSPSFKQAFGAAQQEVAKWEEQGHYEPSFPQMSSTAAVERQLAKWRRAMQCQGGPSGADSADIAGARSPHANDCH